MKINKVTTINPTAGTMIRAGSKIFLNAKRREMISTIKKTIRIGLIKIDVPTSKVKKIN